VVRYEGLIGHSDELIAKNSMRFARHGTYTLRDDIPKYEKVENQIATATNLLPSVVDQQERDEADVKSLPKDELHS